MTDALEGTSIAVAAYHAFDPQGKIETQIRVYYQTEDLSIKEHWYSNGWWSEGKSVGPSCNLVHLIVVKPSERRICIWHCTSGTDPHRCYCPQPYTDSGVLV